MYLCLVVLFIMEITIQQAVKAHQEGKLEEAEKLYRSILKNQPENSIARHNLGSALKTLGKIDEAEASYRKAIELKPDYAEAHYNLGIILQDLSRFDEAETSNRKAIELKPDYAMYHNHLGVALQGLGRLDEAKASFRKAIELKPDYVDAYNNLGVMLEKFSRLDEAEVSFRKAIELNPNHEKAHNNLGNTLMKLSRLDEAETNYRKAIEFKPGYVDAHTNLDLVLKRKRLLLKIKPTNNSDKKNKINFFKKVNTKLLRSDLRLTSNPFISNRKVEAELVNQLYKIKSKKLDDADPVYLRYGNGRSSDYNLFENNFSTIKNVEKDLTDIMKESVKSDIFIMESFFNIFQAGSGIVFHNHTSSFDYNSGLSNQKFSLTYYLNIGDQNCNEPGILKLQDPDKEILPSEGMIVIFPADRKHSATYNGREDRVMIGVNFYSFI